MPKKMAIGTVSHGRKKVAEGKWAPVKIDHPQRGKGWEDNPNLDRTAQRAIDASARRDQLRLKMNQRKANNSEIRDYYKLSHELVASGKVKPKEIIGSGYKNPKATALKWLEKQISTYSAVAEGRVEIKKSMEKSMNVTLVIPLGTTKERVYMPTELLKAKEHLGRVTGSGNAKGTVAPKEPSGGGAGKLPKGASSPESSKSGVGHTDISKRGGHKPPSKNYKTNVGGMNSSAAQNILKLKNTTTGKVRSVNISAGTKNKAKFNHSGNLVSITIGGKKYPCANHLVKLPKGVYQYSGMVSVAAKVGNLSAK